LIVQNPGKILDYLGKIHENLGKTPKVREKFLKIQAK